MECECGCGWAGEDDVTQFCVEEAVYERLEATEKRVQTQMGEALGEADFADGVPGITPGQQQSSEHQARMAELRGGF